MNILSKGIELDDFFSLFSEKKITNFEVVKASHTSKHLLRFRLIFCSKPSLTAVL